jgi:hypothetical protein
VSAMRARAFYVGYSGNVSVNPAIYGWRNATALNGTAPAADITLPLPGGELGGPMAIDTVNQKFYVAVTTNSTNPIGVSRYKYTTDLSTATLDTTLSSLAGNLWQLWPNLANGDLWIAGSTDLSSSTGAICLIAGANAAASGTSCQKTITINAGNSTHSYTGAVYASSNGGTLYIADNGQNSLDLVTSVDGSNGAVNATSTLFNFSGGNVALGAGLLMLASSNTAAATVQAWNANNISGLPVKTVSSSHTGITGMVYIP